MALMNSKLPQARPCTVGLTFARGYLLAAIAVLFAGPVWAADACDGLAQPHGTPAPNLSAEVAKQLHVNRVSIQQTFRSDDWSLLYVVTNEMDRTFLIYSGDPLSTRYVTLWGGAPEDYTDEQVLEWAHSNIPGIPEPLAQCLAWAARQERAP